MVNMGLSWLIHVDPIPSDKKCTSSLGWSPGATCCTPSGRAHPLSRCCRWCTQSPELGGILALGRKTKTPERRDIFNLTLFCDWILPNSASFLGGSSCLFSHGQTLQLIDPPNHRLASKFSLFVTRNSWVIENPKDVLVSICLHTFAGHILIKRLLLKSKVFAGQIHISYQFHPCSPQKTFFCL